MSKTYDPKVILALTLAPNDAEADTFGAYLAALSAKVLYEQEDFSGKRPFGNSDWLSPLIHALILNKTIDGELAEDGYIEDYSSTQFYAALNTVSAFLKAADYSTLELPPEPKEYYLIEFDGLYIVDHTDTPYTKDEAEKQLAEDYSDPRDEGWRVIHIPKVT